jgi:hypothetical protein
VAVQLTGAKTAPNESHSPEFRLTRMDPFTVTQLNGAPVVEGPPGAPALTRAADTNRLLEACFAAGADAALLYAENLPPAFFDLSSGEAGEVLQKLRMYGGIRLAVVAAADGAVRPSSRFGEMAAEERWKGHFGLFDTADEARAWLAA